MYIYMYIHNVPLHKYIHSLDIILRYYLYSPQFRLMSITCNCSRFLFCTFTFSIVYIRIYTVYKHVRAFRTVRYKKNSAQHDMRPIKKNGKFFFCVSILCSKLL